jgi:hypothetical protein
VFGCPQRSIAVLLEGLTEIPTECIGAAKEHGLSAERATDEWAKFRNHHISARSKHTRIDLCWDTWCPTLPNGKEEAVRMVLEEAELVAKNATTAWLPQPIQSWLSCLGCSVKKENGEPMSPLPVPVLSEAERGQLTQTLWMLTQATKPASLKPEDLVEAVRIAMLELPFRMRSSEGHLALTLKVWADAVRD